MKKTTIILKIILYVLGIIISIGAILHIIAEGAHLSSDNGMCVITTGPIIILITLLLDLCEYKLINKKEKK